MRILHVIPQFPYFGGRTIIGGHASCLLTLALAQADAGNDVTILSYVHDRPGRFSIDGVQVHNPFGNLRPGTIRYGLAFRSIAGRWAADHRGAFDVVHSHSGFADYLIVAARLKAVLALPTMHTLYCPIPRTGGRWRLPFVRQYLLRAGRGLDCLAAMSRNVADSMHDFGFGAVEVVPPPVDLQRFAPTNNGAATRQSLGLSDDDTAVLFVGNAKPQKNLAGLLRAFHRIADRHPRAKLVVTTELKQSSSDAALQSLQELVEELQLGDRIVQMGIVDDMPSLIGACDLLAAPFLDTQGPSDYFMVVLEAMASGKPPVVSRVGGMPEVVDDDRGRLIDPLHGDSLADALDAFLGDAELRRACGRGARTYTERHFDPGRIVERHREIYDGILR